MYVTGRIDQTLAMGLIVVLKETKLFSFDGNGF